MLKRRLREIKVSPIGMRCMGFSHRYGEVPDRDYSIKAIRKAHAFGCTFFDTAEAYGPDLLPVNRGHRASRKARPMREQNRTIFWTLRIAN